MSYIKRDTLLETVNDPRNVEVFTDDRWLTKDAGRLVSRKSLMNQVTKHCEYYKDKSCTTCETDKEVHCLTAWKITIGRGMKLY